MLITQLLVECLAEERIGIHLEGGKEAGEKLSNTDVGCLQ